MPVTLTSTGITFSDGTTQTAAAEGAGETILMSSFTAGATGSVSIPSGVTQVFVVGTGGGGGGGRRTEGCGAYSAGGGAGGYSLNAVGTVTPGSQTSWAIGTGGQGQFASTGTAGNATTFGTISLGGGSGGGENSTTNGAGGNVSGFAFGFDYGQGQPGSGPGGGQQNAMGGGSGLSGTRNPSIAYGPCNQTRVGGTGNGYGGGGGGTVSNNTPARNGRGGVLMVTL